MPKLTTDFSISINVLIRDDSTKEKLIAIAYLRGEGSSYAGPVRDALARYVSEFVEGLSPADRRRFDEILSSVRTVRALEKAVRTEGGSVKVKRGERRSLTG